MQWESWMHKTTCLFIYANTQFIATVVICCLAVTGYTMIRQSNRFQPECQLGSFVPLFGYYTQQWRHRNKLLLPMISNKVLRKSLYTCGGFSTLASECLYWSCFCCAFLPFIFGEKITQCKMLTGPSSAMAISFRPSALRYSRMDVLRPGNLGATDPRGLWITANK